MCSRLLLFLSLTLTLVQAEEAALKAFRPLATRALRVAGISQSFPQLTEWRTTHLEDKASILAALKPTDAKNSQAWATYGLACEGLEETAKAIEAYERVLTLRKTHGAVRLRLFLLQGEAVLLTPLKLSEFSLAGKLLADAEPARVLSYLEAAKHAGREKASLAWVLELTKTWKGEDYKALCQAMLSIPSLADEGFSRWCALHPEADPLPMAKLAREALQRAPRSFLAADYGLPSVPWRSSASLLLAHGVEIEADPALETLYTTEASQFLVQAQAYADRRAAKRARMPLAHRLQEVVDAKQHRELSTDLTPLFLTFLETEQPSAALLDEARQLPEFVPWLATLHDSLEDETFLPVLRYLSADKDLFWPCLDYFESKLSSNAQQRQAIAFGQHPLLDSATYEDPAVVTRLLKGSPFLGSLEAFQTYPRDRGRGSLLRDVIQRIRQRPAGQQRSFQILFGSLPQAFGRDFIMAAIDEDAKTSLASLLDSHREAIDALPAARQLQLHWEMPDITWLSPAAGKPDEAAIKAFLASNTTQLSPNALQTQSRTWIRELAAEQADLARQVFWHTAKLGKTEAFANDLLTRLVSGPTSLEVASLALHLLAEPDSEITLTRESPLPFASAILETLDAEETDWEADLGAFFQRTAGTLSHDRAIPLLTDGLWKVIETLAKPDSERLAKIQSWMETDLFKGRQPALARWCAHLASLQTEDPEDDHAAWAGIEQALTNPDLSLGGRLALAESLAALFGEGLPEAVVQSAGATLIQATTGKLASERQFNTLATQLPLSSEDQATIARSWSKQASADYGTRLSLFRLAVKGGDATTINTVAKDSEDLIDFEWLALAQREGKTALVAQWLLKDWERFDWKHGIRTGVLPTFHEAYEELLIPELSEHPEHALYAEALFKALPNPEESELEARSTRLTKLAQGLRDIVWKDTDLEATTLALVGAEAKAALLLADSYSRLGSTLDLEEVTDGLSDIRGKRCQQALLQLASRTSLGRGPNIAQGHLEALLKISKPTVLHKALLDELETAFLEDWSTWEPEVFTANLALLPLATDLQPERWLPLGWALRLLANDAQNLAIPARIRRAKVEDEGAEPPRAAFLTAALEHVTSAFERAQIDSEKKAEITLQISKTPGFMRHLSQKPELHREWFRFLQNKEWLTQEELLKEAGAMAKVAPREGWAWADAATLSSAAGNHADALTHWDSALPFAGQDALRYSTFHLGRLATLFKLGLQDDAAKAIKAFDVKQLHPDFKARWEALRKLQNVRPGGKGAPLV